MLLVGVCERRENARPVSMFVCDCSLSSSAILAAYNDAEHKFESTALMLKPLVMRVLFGVALQRCAAEALCFVQKGTACWLLLLHGWVITYHW